MKNVFSSLVLTFIMIFFISCSSDSSDDMIPVPTPDPDPDPVNITYTNTINSIISQNCSTSACHDNISPQAGLSLTTYAKVKDAFQNNNPLARIESGNMPKDGSKLPQATIDKIKSWVAANYPE